MRKARMGMRNLNPPSPPRFRVVPTFPSGPAAGSGSAPEGFMPRRESLMARREALLGRRLKGGEGGLYDRFRLRSIRNLGSLRWR